MANVEDWPAYVLEFASSADVKQEDLSWLLNWVLGAFSDYGLQLSSSIPCRDQV